jgi:tRNA pseudouridine13 synthase
VVTGPMFGHRLRAPVAGSEAAAREAEILAWAGVALTDFARVGALGEGTRRPLAIEISDGAVAIAAGPGSDDAIDVSFTLPSGAYATTVMREVMKTDEPAAATDPAGDATDAVADAPDSDPS